MRVDLILAFFAFAVLAGLSMVAGTEPESCETYHEMRQIWEDSNSEYGWPKGAVKGCEDED